MRCRSIPVNSCGRRRGIVFAEVEILIFRLQRPRRIELVFDAAAKDVARHRPVEVVMAVGSIGVVLPVLPQPAKGETAGEIEQRAIGGIADTAANGAEPIQIGFKASPNWSVAEPDMPAP